MSMWNMGRELREALAFAEKVQQETKYLREQSRERAAKLQELQAELTVLRKRLEGMYQRTPAIITEAQQKRANLERLLVLAGLSEENPLWKAVLSYADEHARNERLSALGPGQRDGERQYGAGRAASAEDFASALRDLRIMAEREATKEHKEHRE